MIEKQQHQDELLSKINFLRKELKVVGLIQEVPLTKEKFLEKLDKKWGRYYDRNIAEQIFDRMQKTKEGLITVDEFIKIFLEADECLKKKINVAKLSLDELRSTRKETLKLLDDVRKNEVLNKSKIMEGSLINIEIGECILLDSTSIYNEICCEVSIVNESQETQFQLIVENKVLFGENFTFQIISGEELIKFVLKSSDNDFGQMSVPIQLYYDQEEHIE